MRYLTSLLVYTVLSLPANAMSSELIPCPDKPNCVSSLEQGRASYIKPFHYTGDLRTAKAKLLQIIKQQARSSVMRDEANFLHSTFTSRVFSFIDDVEFLFNDNEKVIHVRSASRKGKYDFGTNRRRVESLRVRYNQRYIEK